MKIWRLTAMAVLGAMLLVVDGAGQSGEPGVLLRAAIEKEEVEGDLQAAIEQYKQIIAKGGNGRAVAAKALLRLGGCYEKLGQQEAGKTYQQLIKDYPEQTQEVTAARQRLAALRAGAPAPGQGSTMAIRRVPKLDMYAKPSPDGKYLAYVDWTAGNLALMEVATGATRLLTKDGSWGDAGGYADFSAWSRDSKRIAFGWNIFDKKESRQELRVVSVDRDAPATAIPVPGARYAWPVEWTPDGSGILCGYQVGRGRSELALVSAGGGDTVQKLDLELGAGRWLWPRFTEDGESILYSYPSDGKGAPHDIYLRNLKTGETTAIVEHPAEDLLVGILPGTDWLLFASNRRGRLDLWGVPFRQAKAGGPPVLVKQGIGRFFPLGFTNDGRYYYATLSVTDDVFLMDFDPETGKITGEPRKLTSRWEGANMFPSFSPDGESLAYVTKRGPMPIPTHTADSLVVQSVKDMSAEPLVVGFQEFRLNLVVGPCWMEEGRSVVLGGFGGPESGLYRVDLPSLRKTKIYSVPEGQRLLWHGCESGGRFLYLLSGQRLLRIDIDGRNERELHRLPEGRNTVGLSPDGTTLSLVTSVDNYRRALQIMPSEGGTPRQIQEFRQSSGGFASHVWTPDGKSILYIVKAPKAWTWAIRRISVSGGEGASETSFEWKGPFFGLAFHPNGRLVALTGRSGASTESEVWVIENLRDELKLIASRSDRP